MRVVATGLFAVAVVHTFSVKKFNYLARKFRSGSVGENLFHFLGEVEVVFGVWASVLIGIWSFKYGSDSAISFLESVNFTEPVFVFVIMCMAATRPVLEFCGNFIGKLAEKLPTPYPTSLYFLTLVIGPLLGSFITEPAAMTVTALLLRDNFFAKRISLSFKYATLGLLFVNVSIGGTLTHFAAPPVLMVAGPWGWDTAFMLTHFGTKVLCSILVSTFLTALFFKKGLMRSFSEEKQSYQQPRKEPLWVVLVHLMFMSITIVHSHHIVFIVPLFLLFLGFCVVTNEYQDELKIKESLLVAFFLGGLVTLGKLQDWWLQPILSGLEPVVLFLGAIGLTAVTDNAALTYLGTLVGDLSDHAKYMLVAGAITGGGLTVIANAPNPAGYSILQGSFEKDGISALRLFVSALPYTILTAILFLALP